MYTPGFEATVSRDLHCSSGLLHKEHYSITPGQDLQCWRC